MVAAPIAIQSHRDTVMDFTHPYFYEFSAILLKRPDPDATKWRTLIDPFSPTVFLCIGVSLPLTSFLLCLFEKYNPFYRKVNDRKRVRGLHHYSDSFWYMYGALLTQGIKQMKTNTSTILFYTSIVWYSYICIILWSFFYKGIDFESNKKKRRKRGKILSLTTQLLYRLISRLGTRNSIALCGLKLHTPTPSLNMRSCRQFPHVSIILTFIILILSWTDSIKSLLHWLDKCLLFTVISTENIAKFILDLCTAMIRNDHSISVDVM